METIIRKYLRTFIEEMTNRNYAYNTRKNYFKFIRAFLEFSFEYEDDPADKIRTFLAYKVNGAEHRRVTYIAIKTFYELVLNKECPYQVESFKRLKSLPKLLHREEVLRILEYITNKQHQLMVSLMYSSGLRVGEVVKLKVRDVNLRELSIRVCDGKHHKDRETIFSESLFFELKEQMKNKHSGEYLFIAKHGGKFGVRTIQKVFETAVLKSGIKSAPTCHTLRHSFATHLIEAGVDVKSVKTLLGHKSVTTTMRYVHLANPVARRIKSPL